MRWATLNHECFLHFTDFFFVSDCGCEHVKMKSIEMTLETFGFSLSLLLSFLLHLFLTLSCAIEEFSDDVWIKWHHYWAYMRIWAFFVWISKIAVPYFNNETNFFFIHAISTTATSTMVLLISRSACIKRLCIWFPFFFLIIRPPSVVFVRKCVPAWGRRMTRKQTADETVWIVNVWSQKHSSRAYYWVWSNFFPLVRFHLRNFM